MFSLSRNSAAPSTTACNQKLTLRFWVHCQLISIVFCFPSLMLADEPLPVGSNPTPIAIPHFPSLVKESNATLQQETADRFLEIQWYGFIGQDRLDPGKRRCRQLSCCGAGVLRYLFGSCGANDDAGDVGLPQTPGQGQLCQRHVEFFGKLAELSHPLQILVGQRWTQESPQALIGRARTGRCLT